MIVRNHSCVNIFTKYRYFIWCRSVILGAFAKLRETTVSFVMLVRPSVRPPARSHGTTWLSLDGYPWNLVFWYFSEVCWENSGFIKIWQEWRVLYMETNIHLCSYAAQFFLEWEMFRTEVVEEIKTHIISYVYWTVHHCDSWRIREQLDVTSY